MPVRNPIIIKDMYESCVTELSALNQRSALSSYLNMSQLLTKSLLLSCASLYEEEIVWAIRDVVKAGRFYEPMSTFLEKSAIDGQFYKWFDFRSAKNTNPFLSKFGPDFREKMRQLIDKRENRQVAEANFLELCKKRNESVHRNYAAYSLDLTLHEIYEKHKSAMSYIRIVRHGTTKWLTNE
ncbi:HEPN domain-containing protein [Parahaliea mediterranea]|uniref:RiboL-PSP-HEPN domain-containing protein n=1 Tax=Parahaliea mediterranea TaxID=651086 RepID=A0A939DIF2_9GAMM|nr:HEPN domain-containing protein [Parahaliea mediterranea]MBN7798431.1 hypothetical protein [Parahaliea mediterranea]